MAGSFGGDGTVVEVNGVLGLDTSAQIDAIFPTNTITPTSNFSYPWNGSIVQFRGGDSVPVDPALITALTAAGAPFTQP